MISALSFLKAVKNLLTVVAILVGALILLTTVQPTDAEQEEAPSWKLYLQRICIAPDDNGNMVAHLDCYRAFCSDKGSDCTWLWPGACFKYEGDYCDL